MTTFIGLFFQAKSAINDATLMHDLAAQAGIGDVDEVPDSGGAVVGPV